MEAKDQARPKTLVEDARSVLAECPGLAARTLARRLTRTMEARLAPCGLGLASFGLMARIAAGGDDTIGGLAASLDLDPSTLSRNLKGLAGQGLVEVALVEKDLRRRAVWLTETGARRLEAAMPLWRHALEEVAGVLDVDQVIALRAATNDMA